MKSDVTMVVAVAYIPKPIHDIYTNGLEKTLRKRERYCDWRVVCVPFDPTLKNDDEHLDRLYMRISDRLRKLDSEAERARHNILTDVNLILLYVAGDEVRSSSVFKKFGVEAVVTSIESLVDLSYSKPNDRNRSANFLVKESVRALRHAQTLLGVIADHVQKKDSRTPMLLPPKNFGGNIDALFNGIRGAALDRNEDEKRFIDRIKQISHSLPSVRQGRRQYFQGRSKIAFKGQRKRGDRHGLAPGWGDGGHEVSCVIRGRLRFGIPYDPRFHYDCEILGNANRKFPSCHGITRISAGRRSVNIAPNDNIR